MEETNILREIKIFKYKEFYFFWLVHLSFSILCFLKILQYHFHFLNIDYRKYIQVNPCRWSQTSDNTIQVISSTVCFCTNVWLDLFTTTCIDKCSKFCVYFLIMEYIIGWSFNGDQIDQHLQSNFKKKAIWFTLLAVAGILVILQNFIFQLFTF